MEKEKKKEKRSKNWEKIIKKYKTEKKEESEERSENLFLQFTERNIRKKIQKKIINLERKSGNKARRTNLPILYDFL